MRKRLLALILAGPRHNAEAILITYEQGKGGGGGVGVASGAAASDGGVQGAAKYLK